MDGSDAAELFIDHVQEKYCFREVQMEFIIYVAAMVALVAVVREYGLENIFEATIWGFVLFIAIRGALQYLLCFL